MSFLPIWSNLRGYLVIVVEGKHIEKFINLAVSRGYNLWDITQPRDNMMLAKVDPSVYPALRHVARTCRCKMRILKKKGFPFAAVKMRKRKMLLVGAALFFVSLYILSSFIWSVEVTSNKELKMITEEQVLDAAADYGIKPGTPRFRIDNRLAGEALEKRFMAISWVGVEVRGTKVIINVVEKVLPEEDPESAHPGNLVAGKDGVVKEILVLAGEPKVAAGDTVKKGDILISGVIYPEPLPEAGAQPSENNPSGGQTEPRLEQPIYINAKGLVRARIWYESRAEIPLVQDKEVFTGKTKKLVTLQLFDKEILLKNQGGEKFKNYRRETDVKKFLVWKYRLPLELVTTTFKEVERKQIYYDMAEARTMAETAALKELSGKLPKGAEIVSQKTRVSSANERELKVVVYVETVENISRFVPLR